MRLYCVGNIKLFIYKLEYMYGQLIKKFFIIIIILAFWIIGGAGYAVWKFAFTDKEPNPILITPKGWYMHSRSDGSKIFTRQQELPPVGATESYAYGEQISFEILNVGSSREGWIEKRFPEGDPLYTRKEVGSLKGPRNFQTLEVEHEVGASGKVLEYYLFIDSKAYLFSLYPMESTDPGTGKIIRNIEGIRALDEMIETYGATFDPPREIK